MIVLGVSINANAQHSASDLTGRWETADVSGSIEFIEGSKVVVNISGLQVPATNYTIDFSKDPVWFDVFITSSRAAKGLLQFIDDDTIKWQIFLNGDRPNDFNDSNNPTIVLKRKK
jgi:hypothetical protein